MNIKIKNRFIPILAVFVALAMLAVPLAGVGLTQAPNDEGQALSTDATVTSVPTYNFYVKIEDNSWTTYSGTGYNAYLALKSNTALYSGATINENYVVTKTNSYGPYDTINTDYGKITSLLNNTNDEVNVWHVYYYTAYTAAELAELNFGSNFWVKANDDALGFYKGYSDYAKTYRTANIALYYAPVDADMPSGIPSPTQSIISVSNNEAFQVSFSFTGPVRSEDGTITTTSTPITKIGYGSDAYLALKNVLNTENYPNDVIGNDIVGEYYSWIDTIYGVGTTTDDSGYHYWNIGILTGSTSTYAAFSLGFYTPISNGLNNGNSYTFMQNAFNLTYA